MCKRAVLAENEISVDFRTRLNAKRRLRDGISEEHSSLSNSRFTLFKITSPSSGCVPKSQSLFAPSGQRGLVIVRFAHRNQFSSSRARVNVTQHPRPLACSLRYNSTFSFTHKSYSDMIHQFIAFFPRSDSPTDRQKGSRRMP